jgi:CRISPR-associated endonuclease/helicase Cas3
MKAESAKTPASHCVWGKTHKDVKGNLCVQSLIQHSIRTGAVVQTILEHDSRFRKTLSERSRLPEKIAIAWVVLIAVLHDIGKVLLNFQLDPRSGSARTRILKALNDDGWNVGPDRLAKVPEKRDISHTAWTAALLEKILPFLFAIVFPGGDLATLSKEGCQKIVAIAASHHGMLDRPDSYMTLISSQRDRREMNRVVSLAMSVIMEALPPHAFLPKKTLPVITECDNALFSLISGLISLADHIASNGDLFPYDTDRNEIEAKDQAWTRARQGARKACTRAGLLGWKSSPFKVLPASRQFPDIRKLRPLQMAGESLGRVYRTSQLPDLVICEEMPGAGKTEFALLLSLYLMGRKGLRGMVYALPTTAMSNQAFRRMEKWIGRILKSMGRRANGVLAHGQAILSELFQDLKRAGKDASLNGLVSSEWFGSNLRALHSNFVVSTIDQVFMAILQARYSLMRLSGIAGKVLIFDEVHVYDAYMLSLYKKVLTYAAALGCPVIILSATLSEPLRKEMMEAYAKGKGLDPKKELPGLGKALKEAYPRITAMDSAGKVDSRTFKTSLRKNVSITWVPRIETVPGMGTMHGAVETIASRLRKEFANEPGGMSVAYFCNTVGYAQDVKTWLDTEFAGTGVEVILFHSQFCEGDRKAIEDKVLRQFGPERTGRDKVILVTTQVAEQSLDIDFDLVITEMAPIDLIIQRIGRLFRHAWFTRPQAHPTPEVWLLEPETDQCGPCFKAYPFYDEYILLKTWYTLTREGRTQIRIPEQMDELIARVYQQEDRLQWGLSSDETIRLAKALDNCKTKRTAYESAARRNAIPDPRGENDMFLTGFDTANFDDEEDSISVNHAKTRMDPPGISAVVVYEIPGMAGFYFDPQGMDPVAMTPPRVDRRLEGTAREQALRVQFKWLEKMQARSIKLNYAREEVERYLLDFPVKPDEWAKVPFLKHCRLMVMDPGGTYPGIQTLTFMRLDPVLGLIKGKRRSA